MFTVVGFIISIELLLFTNSIPGISNSFDEEFCFLTFSWHCYIQKDNSICYCHQKHLKMKLPPKRKKCLKKSICLVGFMLFLFSLKFDS